ncbi:hypothetical protein KSP40_PGU006398 [Platanthera guangdongensis]|uniref:Uncharacterized protein n=1 Tax=Platanthera guangdongensis TaxID=2320717 RepID=A0ABR2MY83_9ASPA
MASPLVMVVGHLDDPGPWTSSIYTLPIAPYAWILFFSPSLYLELSHISPGSYLKHHPQKKKDERVSQTEPPFASNAARVFPPPPGGSGSRLRLDEIVLAYSRQEPLRSQALG